VLCALQVATSVTLLQRNNTGFLNAQEQVANEKVRGSTMSGFT
jgi:hypothetical protein